MKKMFYISVIIIISPLMIFIVSCGHKNKNLSTNSLQGKVSISGAFALYPMTVKWAEEFKKIHPNVTIDISAGGAGKGMVDVLNGLVDIAMFSREVSNEEQAKGAWFIAVARDAVLPTINVSNPAYRQLKLKGIKKQDFIDIFITGKITKWGQLIAGGSDSKINVFTLSDACGAAEMWAKYLDKKQEDLSGVGIYGDPGMSDAVKKDKYGMGYNNIAYAFDSKTKKNYDGIAIIPIDLNENGRIDSSENFFDDLNKLTLAIKTEVFPSPPARDLYLITKGKPTNALLIEFLNFVLSDGQKYINEAGYVVLSESKLAVETKKLN